MRLSSIELIDVVVIIVDFKQQCWLYRILEPYVWNVKNGTFQMRLLFL